MKKNRFAAILIILGIVILLAIFGIWFLLYGNKLLGGVVYNSKSGYLLDIQQIEASCAKKIPLVLSPTADGTKMLAWGKQFGYTNSVFKNPNGSLYVELDITNPNWKEAIKQARLNDLISSYVVPPIPLDGCK